MRLNSLNFGLVRKNQLEVRITSSEKKQESYRPGDFDQSQGSWAIKMIGRRQSRDIKGVFYLLPPKRKENPPNQNPYKHAGIYHSEKMIFSL